MGGGERRPHNGTTYYGALLTMAHSSLWRTPHYGALLTLTHYLLWRTTYYGALLTMAHHKEAAVDGCGEARSEPDAPHGHPGVITR